MPRIKVVVLTDEQRAALETGYKQGTSHEYRLRCQALLLKGQPDVPRTSVSVAEQLGCCEMAVNNWVARFEQGGPDALTTRPGRGRRAILQAGDLKSVKVAVQRNRQKLSLAKAELEQTLGKEFGVLTLKRFLGKIAAICPEKTVAASNANACRSGNR